MLPWHVMMDCAPNITSATRKSYMYLHGTNNADIVLPNEAVNGSEQDFGHKCRCHNADC
jgi:hypothetical protein